MAALREVFARFGVEVDDKKLDNLNKKVEGGISTLSKFGGVLVGALGSGALFKFASHISEVGDEIAKNAIRIGISGERLQALGFAAGQSGASIEGLKVAMLSLSDRMQAAGQGSKETAAAFAHLGIKVKDSSGNLRGSDEVLLDAADAISKIKSPTEQAAVAMDLFGRQGRELLPFLKGGAAGIRELTDEAEALGGGFSGDALKASEEYNDALGRMSFALSSVQGKIAKALLPVLQRLVDGVTKGVAWFARWVSGTRLIETALISLGAIVAVFAAKSALALAPVVAPFVAWGILIAGLVLLFEDLWGTFEGKDSLIRRIVDGLFGIGTTAEGVKVLKDAWEGFKDGVIAVLPYLREAWTLIKNIVEKGAAVYGKTLGLAARAGGAIGDFAGSIGVADAETAYTLRNPGARSSQETAAGRAGLISSPTVNANVTINGVGDEKEAAKALREELERLNASINRAAAQALTREAPAQ